MPVYGNRPEDVVVDAAGNVQTGATLTLHATQADAQAKTNTLTTVTTSAGRWSADLSQSPVWVRTPNGAAYEIQDFSTKADADPVTAVTYNPDGTVKDVTENGIKTSYTYNTDGTIATQTRQGVTRTYSYSGGNLTGVA